MNVQQYFRVPKVVSAPPYTPPVLAFSGFGSLGTGTNKYSGSGKTNSGMIYMIPSTESRVLKLNPATDTITQFGSLGTTGEKWAGGGYAPNGKIYGCPLVSGSVLKIDPDTDTVSTFGSGLGGRHGIILAGNGKLYCIPWSATNILEIDPATDTTTTFGSVSGTSPRYGGACLFDNGKIYCAPWNATTILEIDPTSKTIRQFGSVTGSSKYFGALNGGDGFVYFIPHTAGKFLRLNPLTDELVEVGNQYAGLSFGGAVDKQGNVYGIPQQNSRILELYYPPTSFSDFYDLPNTVLDASNIWLRGAVFANNGVLYGIPSHNTKIPKIEGMATFDPVDYTLPANLADLPTSSYNRHFNKF